MGTAETEERVPLRQSDNMGRNMGRMTKKHSDAWHFALLQPTAASTGILCIVLLMLPHAMQDAIVQPGEGDLLPYDLFSLRFSLADIESGRMWQVGGGLHPLGEVAGWACAVSTAQVFLIIWDTTQPVYL
jgi:hypothetical protein